MPRFTSNSISIRAQRLRLSTMLAASALVAITGCSSDETSAGSGASGPGSGGSASGSGGQGASASSATSSSATGSGGDATGGSASGGAASGGESTAGSGGVATGGSNAGGGGTGGMMMAQDADGDGWTIADGDCCDAVSIVCATPAKVNPGAFEYLGNQVDDDCDPGTADNVAPADCGGAPLDTPTTADELARAIDLCLVTTESPPLPQKKWGVITTSLLLADGTATAPKDVQRGVLASYGTNVTPKKNATMAAISSGTARALGDPGYVHPQNGSTAAQVGNYNANTQAGVPPAWLAANGGALPPPTTCPACSGANCTQAFDSVNLKLRIRVPTNALSFSYNFKFYTAEYPEYVCQQYNDFFVTLLTSTEPTIPADKNIAFDDLGNEVSVNNGFLDVCFGCSGGTLDLLGNGMGGWGNNEVDEGGATKWLTNEAPVVPGETIEIEFVTWDAADHNVDSLVLIDNFRWDVDASTVGTHE